MKCQDDGHCFDAVGPLPPAFPGSDPAGQGKVYQSCQKARITSSSKATKGLELKVFFALVSGSHTAGFKGS